MGVEYQVVCYKCKVGLYIGKLCEGLTPFHSELLKYFLLDHNCKNGEHEIGLEGDAYWTDGIYFPTDPELLDTFEIPIDCKYCFFRDICKEKNPKVCTKFFFLPYRYELEKKKQR